MPRINQVFPNDKSGGLFRFLMEKYGLKNHKELSEKTGVTRSTISRISNGKQDLSKDNKHDIMKATGMSLKALEKLVDGKQ